MIMASDQEVIRFGTNAVYEGFWHDQDRGKILGATLTLRDTRAIPLVAALAIIVGIAGNRSWHISRLAWHSLLNAQNGDTTAVKRHRGKEQVILRNSETAAGVTVGFIEMIIETGFLRALRECSLKDGMVVLYAVGHWLLFIALGVLVSQVVVGKVVVSKVCKLRFWCPCQKDYLSWKSLGMTYLWPMAPR
jgi:hypothetical protein